MGKSFCCNFLHEENVFWLSLFAYKLNKLINTLFKREVTVTYMYYTFGNIVIAWESSVKLLQFPIQYVSNFLAHTHAHTHAHIYLCSLNSLRKKNNTKPFIILPGMQLACKATTKVLHFCLSLAICSIVPQVCFLKTTY